MNKQQPKTISSNANIQNTSSENDFLLQKLEEIGLTRTEATIYLSLLRLGNKVDVSKIASVTGIHRQYIYLTLEKLTSSSLVLCISTGARYKYRAMPPSAIERFARKKFDTANETAQALTKISALGNEQDFEIYLGDQQVKDYENEYISGLRENEEQFVISGASENFLTYFKKEYARLAIHGKEKKLKTFYIGGPHEKESLGYAHSMNSGFQYKTLPGMPNGVTSTVIRRESVIIYSLAQPPLIYAIHSKIVSNEFKAYFDMLWNLAK